MKHQLLEMLCCPNCKIGFHLTKVDDINGEIESGQLVCTGCTQEYPIVRAIPRFVPADNYASNWGVQWNRFRQTQLDSYSGLPISRNRFFRQTGWPPDDLAGKSVLDVGCGAGRFAEIALACGANLVAVDCSAAVDACRLNFGLHPALNVVQADICHLPFKPGSFDFVYCFGVLQHTPNVEKACLALPAQLREGGCLAVDVYPKLAGNLLWPKYWLRPLTKRMAPSRLLSLVQLMVKLLLPVSMLIGRIPVVGRKLRYSIPVANYEGVYPLSRAQLQEWAVLDTFDMFAPIYDSPQSPSSLLAWFKLAGLEEVEIIRLGHLVGRGRKMGRSGAKSHGRSAEQQDIRWA